MDNIIKELKDIEQKYNSEIQRAESLGFIKGFKLGFTKGFELENTDCNIEGIDWHSIKVFSKWCYINGIDFSYMGKATDTVPFTERVVERFEHDMNDKKEVKNYKYLED